MNSPLIIVLTINFEFVVIIRLSITKHVLVGDQFNAHRTTHTPIATTNDSELTRLLAKLTLLLPHGCVDLELFDKDHGRHDAFSFVFARVKCDHCHQHHYCFDPQFAKMMPILIPRSFWILIFFSWKNVAMERTIVVVWNWRAIQFQSWRSWHSMEMVIEAMRLVWRRTPVWMGALETPLLA